MLFRSQPVLADHVVEDNLQRPGCGQTHGRFNKHGPEDDNKPAAIGADEFEDEAHHCLAALFGRLLHRCRRSGVWFTHEIPVPLTRLSVGSGDWLGDYWNNNLRYNILFANNLTVFFSTILKDSRVVFNICGNKYRLVVKISYKNAVVFLRFIGTHNDYDAVDVEVV